MLRAVAGQLFHERQNVDYFPSYEIITSSLSKGRFFEANLRSVRAEGVAAAMNVFFTEHASSEAQEVEASRAPRKRKVQQEASADDDVVCEEILLDAFSP